jgi:hypothetical protein
MLRWAETTEGALAAEHDEDDDKPVGGRPVREGPTRRLTDQLKKDLLALVDRERPVLIAASLHHEEAQDLAQQMRTYLLAKGVKAPPVEHQALREEEMGLGFDEVENRIFVFRGS